MKLTSEENLTRPYPPQSIIIWLRLVILIRSIDEGIDSFSLSAMPGVCRRYVSISRIRSVGLADHDSGKRFGQRERNSTNSVRAGTLTLCRLDNPPPNKNAGLLGASLSTGGSGIELVSLKDPAVRNRKLLDDDLKERTTYQRWE